MSLSAPVIRFSFQGLFKKELRKNVSWLRSSSRSGLGSWSAVGQQKFVIRCQIWVKLQVLLGIKHMIRLAFGFPPTCTSGRVLESSSGGYLCWLGS